MVYTVYSLNFVYFSGSVAASLKPSLSKGTFSQYASFILSSFVVVHAKESVKLAFFVRVSSLALTHKSLAADLTQTAIELLLLVAAN